MARVGAVVAVPEPLVTSASLTVAEPRKRRRGGPSQSAGVTRRVSELPAQGRPPLADDRAMSFTVVGAPPAWESADLAPLLNASLQHEATLQRLAQRVGVSVEELLSSLQATVTQPDATSFSDAETHTLAAASVDLSGPDQGPAGVQLAGRAAAHRLTSEAWTVDEAAAELSVTPGRVRQRLSAGELVGLRRADGQTVLPRWQISDGRIVPGLELVMSRTDDVHPLALARFMTTPHPDLELDGDAVAPRTWLQTGGSAQLVAGLVSSLALLG